MSLAILTVPSSSSSTWSEQCPVRHQCLQTPPLCPCMWRQEPEPGDDRACRPRPEATIYGNWPHCTIKRASRPYMSSHVVLNVAVYAFSQSDYDQLGLLLQIWIVLRYMHSSISDKTLYYYRALRRCTDWRVHTLSVCLFMACILPVPLPPTTMTSLGQNWQQYT